VSEIRGLGPDDAAVLAKVADEVFDNPVDPGLAAEFLAAANCHMAVALEAGVVVGFASGVAYVHPDKPRELFVNEVAVAPPWRRRGLARGLVAALLEKARAAGCGHAWVLTNRSNPAALALYSSLGGVAGAEGMGEDIVGYEFELAG
jgi:ribosomal protein S18 acetylase RimI-like enzyme